MKFTRSELEIKMGDVITKAIEFCYELIDKYDDGRDIDDIDISYIIEILKGRE